MAAPCKVVIDNTYELLQSSEAALVTSGTATLEAALFGVPQVVCYKTSALSYWLAKQWVKLEWISLVNLILDQQVIQELIQEDLTVTNMVNELNRLLQKEEAMSIQTQYDELRKSLGGEGASERVAQSIYQHLC